MASEEEGEGDTPHASPRVALIRRNLVVPHQSVRLAATCRKRFFAALLRIKWEQVDLTSACIWMQGKKANRKPEPVAVPIYGDMRPYLDMQPHTSEFLFARGSVPIRDFRMSWNLACQAAGVPGLLFHDLRRTAVRNLRRAGVAESVIMKITGHRTRGVFERYNITDQTDTMEAGKLAEEFLNQAHSEKSSQNSSQNRRRPN